ncbi:TNF receptor-associated factor 2 [Geodia barretti]|uniref:TNF receptor-associated factor 2 n=1 Tax=Geodia barretti TaxID=519541 RepID=A0AA35T3B5_GEOBA|nr:TNF receptor-associated factor 2 [Geodia barretti]
MMDEARCTVRKDRGCQREIESLEVDCPTQPHPCSWRGKLTDMEHHESEECPKRLRECDLKCGGKYLAEELEQHMARDCNRRPVPCQYCKHQLPMKDLQDHYMGCEQAPGVCTHCKQTLESKTEVCFCSKRTFQKPSCLRQCSARSERTVAAVQDTPRVSGLNLSSAHTLSRW